jgi:hypothetical protein
MTSTGPDPEPTATVERADGGPAGAFPRKVRPKLGIGVAVLVAAAFALAMGVQSAARSVSGQAVKLAVVGDCYPDDDGPPIDDVVIMTSDNSCHYWSRLVAETSLCRHQPRAVRCAPMGDPDSDEAWDRMEGLHRIGWTGSHVLSGLALLPLAGVAAWTTVIASRARDRTAMRFAAISITLLAFAATMLVLRPTGPHLEFDDDPVQEGPDSGIG